MAIQIRTGSYEDYDVSKLVRGEPAGITDGDPGTSTGKSVRLGWGDGTDSVLVVKEELDQTVEDQLDEALDDYTAALLGDITAATNAAATAATAAGGAAAAADAAKTAANSAAAAANSAAQAATEAAAHITVDSAISGTSEHPVQNKVIKTALDEKQDELTFDTAPTANSNNPVKSGGIYTALQGILGDFATVETSSSASRAYKVGEYLTRNNLLYRVTTAISSGGTISPGTNCVQTRVALEIANRVLWWSEKSVASTGGTSGTLMTISDTRITSDDVLDKFVAADPSVIISDITCVTSAGQAVITGISTAATTAEILLIKKNN